MSLNPTSVPESHFRCIQHDIQPYSFHISNLDRISQDHPSSESLHENPPLALATVLNKPGNGRKPNLSNNAKRI